MTRNFTTNLIVKHLYNEASALESLEVIEMLENDPNLKAEYERMELSKNLLPKISFAPSNDSIDQIMSYSRQQTINSAC